MVERARAVLACLLAAPALSACVRSQAAGRPPKANEVSMTETQTTPRIEIFAQLAPEGPVRLDVVDVDRASGGAELVVPGPRRRPVRPHLEPFPTATAAVAARAVRGDGEVAPVAVIVGDAQAVIPLPAPPLAVAPRRDGVWALYREHLAHHAADGSEVRRIKLTGVLLVGSADDGVWLAGLDAAHHVDAQGAVRGPYPWRGGLTSAASGSRLCALRGREAGVLSCLDPAGAETSTPLPAPPRPLEQLLAQGAYGFVLAQGSTVRWIGKDGAARPLNIQGAGVGSRGEGFLSTLEGGRVVLHVAGAPPRTLPLPAEAPPQGPFGVVAVEGERVLAAGLDRAAWYKGGQAERSFSVDEASYRGEVFPQAWRAASTRVVALADGSLVVSTTGPAGMVLLKISAP